MNKEFVTYEQALALKELRFNEDTICVYNSYFHLKGCITSSIDGDYVKRDKWDDRLAAPTYSQAFRWFREKLEVESFVRYKYELAVKSGYYFKIDHPKIFNFMDYDSKTYKTHPEAESACLDKLIEISK